MDRIRPAPRFGRWSVSFLFCPCLCLCLGQATGRRTPTPNSRSSRRTSLGQISFCFSSSVSVQTHAQGRTTAGDHVITAGIFCARDELRLIFTRKCRELNAPCPYLSPQFSPLLTR